MNDRRKLLVPATFPPRTDYSGMDNCTHVRVSLYYFKTGKRGIYATFGPVKIDGQFESESLFDSRSGRTLLLELPRFNQKKYDAVADAVLAKADAIAALVAAGDLPLAASVARHAANAAFVLPTLPEAVALV